jgi:hypothetical protein
MLENSQIVAVRRAGSKPMAKDRSGDVPTPVGAGEKPLRQSRSEVEAFLRQARALRPRLEEGRRGRLIFALDATMSRQPTWDTACRLQAEMFREAGKIGGLDVQLVYYRGFGECRASTWVSDADRLADLMSRIDCRGGHTQIGKVLAHARRETEKARVQALVFIGDAMEENIDSLAAIAGELGLLGVPIFAFQEGREPAVERAFREFARLTRGAYCRFDPGSAHELAELLRAAAVFAAGGLRALSSRSEAAALKLIAQLK